MHRERETRRLFSMRVVCASCEIGRRTVVDNARKQRKVFPKPYLDVCQSPPFSNHNTMSMIHREDSLKQQLGKRKSNCLD